MNEGDTFHPHEAAILDEAAARRRFDYRKHPVDPRLAAFVLNFWTITWEVEAPYTARVLPLPTQNLSVTNTEADVTGLVRGRYERHLHGQGWAVGVRFRPACFRPFVHVRVSALTDTHRPISEVLGRPTEDLRCAVEATEDREQRVRLLADFLCADLPDVDPLAERLCRLVVTVLAEPSITRADQVAELAGVGLRTLQRQFAEYVGAGPKWLIGRRRILEAVARAGEPHPPDWTDLATDLGYADQAHLTRAFAAVTGRPPGRYAAAEGPDVGGH